MFLIWRDDAKLKHLAVLVRPVSPCLFWTPCGRSVSTSLSHQRRETRRRWWFLFLIFNLLRVCWRVCVSTLCSFEATPLQVCGRLGYLKPWKDKKTRRKQNCCLHICHPPVTSLSSFLRMVVLPRARSSSPPAAQNQREVLRCCRWNAAVFVSVLRFVVLLPVFSFRLRCPVLTDYELYKATRGCSSIDPGSGDQKCRLCRGVMKRFSVLWQQTDALCFNVLTQVTQWRLIGWIWLAGGFACLTL